LINSVPLPVPTIQGDANIIENPKQIDSFEKGQVLVTRITDPDWEPIMKIASAIVTNEGGRTSHAAIVSRELGIPCIVGTGNGTELIKKGQNITIDCSSGSDGLVWSGETKWEVKKYTVDTIHRPKTHVYVNVGSPNEAFKSSFLPNDGVGLAREEFIIASQIKIHPNALIDFDKLEDAKLKKEIAELTHGYPDKTEFYVQNLAQGIAKIGAAFYPKPVIVRFSDFKTNEYASLLGGSIYEPKEQNPMIGWRGASRYYDPRFEEAFGLECQAIQQVRDVWGINNIIVMVPFCRTVDEGKKVLKTMAKYGLKRGKNGLKVYMMCEIPADVILVDEFLEIFDGYSIGSNDLTQLTVGIDRDNGDLAKIANENNPAIKELITAVVKAAKKHRKYIGICGQAPSDYPDFAQFLVKLGIDSISLNPDSILKTTLAIMEEEKKLHR
jgi:pyruvate,water dikinase